ncbi:MAG: tryptophan-rich sensory protein [Planctomycetota bacterium]|nr:tryptophan-rich sensory protein [Planctomycetota bacterium]
MTRTTRNVLVLAAFLLIVYAVSALGALSTGPAVKGWYTTIQKPAWTPPSWLFGPVWITLYTMMAVAAWLVWRRRDNPGRGVALTAFAVQLILNAVWSPLFFGLHRIDLALIDIAGLWLAILLTILLFFRIRPAAGWLLVPYLLWCTYAGALNLALWRLNA